MNNQKTYSEKLKDPRWQKKRLEIFQRDNFSCQLCLDNESTLQVHHFCYDVSGNPWDVDGTALITYCEVCHQLVELYKELPYTLINVDKISFEKFIAVNCMITNSMNQGAIAVYEYSLSTKKIELKGIFNEQWINSIYNLFHNYKKGGTLTEWNDIK